MLKKDECIVCFQLFDDKQIAIINESQIITNLQHKHQPAQFSGL